MNVGRKIYMSLYASNMYACAWHYLIQVYCDRGLPMSSGSRGLFLYAIDSCTDLYLVLDLCGRWVEARIIYRTRYHSWLKSVASSTHMSSGNCETQLLAPVLCTMQRKHALPDLGGICIPLIHFDPSICLDTPHMFGCPLYVWMPPCMFGSPICSDSS